MTQYNVIGMSCAACVARVEKAVNSVPGVTSCSVSLLTNSMGVEGSASKSEIIKAVNEAGYEANVKGSAKKSREDNDALKDTETPKLKRRVVLSLVFLLVLMYISMGHVMFGWYLPQIFASNPMAIGITQLLLTIIIMVINQKFFINGFKGLLNKSPNMDTLVALGSGASFLYSVYILYKMTVAGDTAYHYLHQFYFESAATILTLITVGKMLEAYSKGRTTDALKSLMKLSPETATLLRDGKETEVPVEQVIIGDIFTVRPGEQISVDGIIIEGVTEVDESALTGESVFAEKVVGNSVHCGTINQSGYIKCKATRVGEDTTLAQIIKTVSDAAATKAPIAKVADKVSGVFVPCVMIIAIVATIIWLFVGESLGFALARGISVLVISCPCALGLATPVAIMVGSGVGAKTGILFKTAVSLEETCKAKTVVLDKTGTITEGRPAVTDIITADGTSENELLSIAYSLESKSEHPLSKAVIEKCEALNVSSYDVQNFKSLPGNGITATRDNTFLYGGNRKFVSGYAEIDEYLNAEAEKLADNGITPLFFGADKKILGMIAVADTVKSDSPKAIKELQNMGLRVVMLTGDNRKTANAIGKISGVDYVIAEVLPEGKQNVVNELKNQGKVIMVGDGINDAPALTSADVGIAIGAGTDVAIDAADVVLMKNRLSDVAAAIRLSRHTLKNIYENLFWAFFYNALGIPLAAGVFINAFGWELNPMFGAAAMSLSSFCVVSNALRLNLVKIYDTKKDKNRINKTKEQKTMKVTMEIEGMMCSHCEATVKKTLEEFAYVQEAHVKHNDGTAVITTVGEVNIDSLKKAVEDKGYKVVGYKSE